MYINVEYEGSVKQVLDKCVKEDIILMWSWGCFQHSNSEDFLTEGTKLLYRGLFNLTVHLTGKSLEILLNRIP